MEVDKTLSETIEKDIPRVPIKTYQWEDVRRSRKKGGYPWTHITKPPYEGEEDPEGYTLEAYRRSRSRSTSTIGKARSESASTFGDRSPSPYDRRNEGSLNHSRTPSTVKVDQHQPPINNKKNVVTSLSQPNFENFRETTTTFERRYERSISPPSNERTRSLTRDLTSGSFQRSKSPSRSFSEKKSESPPNQRRSRSPTKKETTNSTPIVEQTKIEMEQNEPKVSKELDLDGKTNESFIKSDENVNKPLDEISLSPEEEATISTPATKDTRSRIEEKADSKRKLKRRLSVQSSYSRISLTKQSILDRIKSTKRSLKPSKLVKRSKSDVTHEKKPINTKGRKSIDTTKTVDKPVYIHIPLKPPPGKTDEFSYLEFEKNPPPVGQLPEKKNGKKEVFGDDRDGSPIVGVILEFDDPDKKDRYTSKEINDIISKMGNGANVQQIDAKDLFPEITEQSAKIKEIVDSIDDKATIVATDGKEVLEEVEVNNKAEVLEKLKQVENGSGSTQSIIKTTTDDKDLQTNSSQPPMHNLDVQSNNNGVQIQEMSSREGSTSSTSNIRSPGMLTDKPIISEPDEDNISQYLDKDEPVEVESSRTESAEPEATTKDSTDEKTQPFKGSDLDVPKNRKRARSEEPATRKRKHSIDSSYSRKSLSKLAFLKKFKNFTDKIKIPSLKKSESKEKVKEKPKEDQKEIPQPKPKHTVKTSKKDEPKYIYIPLKPPEGETDEFSKFADEPPKETNASSNNNKELKREDTETSVETPTNDVQIIILTPPSDDEILDANLPETPSESDQKSFDNMQIDNLKHLAKKVVDEVYPNSHELQTVQEENNGSDENLTKKDEEQKVTEEAANESPREGTTASPKEVIEVSSEGITKISPEGATEASPEESNVPPKEVNETPPKESKEGRVVLQERILVDEEDGLKLSEVAVAMINEELAKESLPQMPSDKVKAETPPAAEDVVKIKKKVLFKNKKRTDDGEYEYITIPDSQRSSYVEDKPREELDTCQIKEDVELIKGKLEEGSSKTDGKKWSEIDDHEYEPINPPPEEMAHGGPPQIHITSPQLHTRIHDVQQRDSALSSTTSLERQYLGAASGDEDLSNRNADIGEAAVTPQELQTQIEERYFSATPMTAPSITTSQTDSSTVQIVSTTKNDSKKDGETKPEDQQGNKFNEAIKHQAEALKAQAGKIKSKFQNMKKPTISKPKFQAPSFKMPKLGDRAKIHMPSFKKNTEKRSSWQEQRQFSTESNVGEPKKHFDFGTFPKLFDRGKKGRKGSLGDFEPAQTNVNVQTSEVALEPEFATVPRASRKKGPIGSRWSKKFKDIEFADDDQKENLPEERPTTIRISLHEEMIEDIPSGDGSHIRYNQDIDIEEEFERENKVHEVSPFSQKYLKRWEHGEFHEGPSPTGRRLQITDLDEPQTPPELELPRSNGIHSSGSLSDHRRGVIEEIDSDEFFLREKGISQEDIEVGKYLSTEIREAFRNPVNSLSEIDGLNGESDQSLQEPPPRKKPVRKPKRKKTPHVSQENVSFDRESVTEPEEYRTDDIRSYPPPSRPKRRSKTKKSKKDNLVPYQETIAMDQENYDLEESLRDIESDILPDNILSSDVQQNGFDQNTRQVYENEHMQGIEQPEIVVSNPEYAKRSFHSDIEQPAPPPRKHRSLKSLDISEQDSILDDSIDYKDTPMQEVVVYRGEHEYIIPTPEPPQRSRKTRSRSQSQVDDDRTSRGADSLTSENLVPVVEEICIKDIRDSSGYAIIDKQKPRDPPLPPTRFPTTPPRKRKSKNIEKTKVITQTKFFTVPRKQKTAPPPERPTRNYSTLGSPSKPIRKKSLSSSQVNADNKENIDISQYTEIEDQPVRRLQSGEIVQKMKDRPLPAPPRPPRRQRDGRDALQDITNGDNQPSVSEEKEHVFDETEVSTQTEPLPDDFICEPLTQEETDRVIIPTEEKKAENKKQESFEETITHGALIVQPLPYSALHQPGPGVERIIQTRLEESDEETSEIPEDFKKLKSPPPRTESSADKRPITPTYDSSAEIELLKTQKLQVADLDVDKLRVNQLQANKIMVSEIEGFSIQVNEINSRSGNLVVSGIELPPHLLQELVDRLQSIVPQQSSHPDENGDQSVSQKSETESTLKIRQESISEDPTKKEESEQQKKTPIDEEIIIVQESIISGVPPPQNVESSDKVDETESEYLQNLENQQLLLDQQPTEEEPPKRPPRKASVTSASITQETEEETQPNSSSQKAPPSSNYSASASSLQSINENENESPSAKEVKESEREEPPPRPPQPEYIASQPPASFFALRSQPYSELLAEAIPMPPRRKRHVRATLVTQSSSEDNVSLPRRRRSPETSIPELTGQLTRACIISAENSIRRLIASFSDNVLRNKDGKQDAYVMIIILLVLIAGILLLTGDPKIIVHHHHWEYFNPPRDL